MSQETIQISASRRQFIKTFVLGTVASTLGATPWSARFLTEIQAQSTPGVGLLRLQVSDYPALAQVHGSIRVSVNPIQRISPLNIKPDGDFYPIIINRLALSGDNQFVALNSKCTHMECVVGQYDAVFDTMICPCHSSTYDVEGQVTGGPALATGSLTKYGVQFDGQNNLVIEVPGLGYAIQGSLVANQAPASNRFKLEFPTFVNAEYEVHHFVDLQSPATLTTFALAPAGNLDQTSLVGDGQPIAVYVEQGSNTGFYRVSIKPREIAAD